MNNLDLSYAQPEDAKNIFFLTQSAKEDLFDNLGKNRVSKILYDYYVSSLFRNIDSDNTSYIIAKIQDQFVGFLKYNRRSDNHKAINFDDKFNIELFQLFVSHDFQSKGIGKKLVHKMLNDNLELDNIYLLTNLSNHNAIRFYENIGFYKHSTYDNGEKGFFLQQKMSGNISQIYQNLKKII